MKCEVTAAEFLLGTVQHGADPTHLHVEGFGEFLIRQSRGTNDQEVRLRRVKRGQDGSYATAVCFVQHVVQRTRGRPLMHNRPGSLLVLAAASSSAQSIDTEVGRGAV